MDTTETTEQTGTEVNSEETRKTEYLKYLEENSGGDPETDYGLLCFIISTDNQVRQKCDILPVLVGLVSPRDRCHSVALICT